MIATLEQYVVALEAAAPALPASVSNPDSIRVLLIEDDPIDRGFLTDGLSKQGLAVRRCASLLGAPDAAHDADVIVLHCDCAKISGIELLAKLQRLDVNVPVVLLTDEHRRSMNVWLSTEARSTSSASHGFGRFNQAPQEGGQGFQAYGSTAVRQIHDLRQAASAS
jgi:DNA-binding NarL/FixJ family response regulator